MNPSIDIRDQVYDVARAINGGTNNDYGAAQEQLVLPFFNDSGATISVGSVVKLNPGLTLTETAGEYVLGVVVGRYDPTTGQQLAGDPANEEMAAVCVAGRTQVVVTAAVSRGAWLIASATDGQATNATGILAEHVFARALLAAGAGDLAVVVLGGGASGTATASLSAQYYDINFIFSAGGSVVPVVGSHGVVNVSAPGTIVAARMLGLPSSGSAVVDVEKATYSGFPTTSSICASAKPTLSSAQKSEDTTLTGWTTSLAMGDVLLFQLDSISGGLFIVTCALKVRRS